MDFKMMKDPVRIVDLEAGLELVRVGGAYGIYREQFFPYPRHQGATPLTCRYSWKEKTRYPTRSEMEHLPPNIEVITILEVSDPHGEGPILLPGKSGSETMAAITAALLSTVQHKKGYLGEYGKYRIVSNAAVTVEFSEQLTKSMTGPHYD